MVYEPLYSKCTILTSDAIVLGGSTGHSVGYERRHLHSVAMTVRTAKHLHHFQQLPAAQLGSLLETEIKVLAIFFH